MRGERALVELRDQNGSPQKLTETTTVQRAAVPLVHFLECHKATLVPEKSPDRYSRVGEGRGRRVFAEVRQKAGHSTSAYKLPR